MGQTKCGNGWDPLPLALSQAVGPAVPELVPGRPPVVADPPYVPWPRCLSVTSCGRQLALSRWSSRPCTWATCCTPWLPCPRPPCPQVRAPSLSQTPFTPFYTHLINPFHTFLHPSKQRRGCAPSFVWSCSGGKGVESLAPLSRLSFDPPTYQTRGGFTLTLYFPHGDRGYGSHPSFSFP